MAQMLVDIANAELVIGRRLHLTVREMQVPRSTIAVVLGPNGSGKSTLARYLCRIDGAERVTAAREMRPQPAGVMVWQALNLFPLTVRRNIDIVNPKGGETALKYFKLWMLRDYHIDSLSGGERQRLALARGFVTEADLVVLDEPTSSLDSSSVHDLVEAIGAYTSHTSVQQSDYLKTLQSSEGGPLSRTVVIITHDLRFVRMLSKFTRVRVFSLSEAARHDNHVPTFILNSPPGGEGYTIDAVHTSPPDLFVADFFGLSNIVGYTATVGKARSAGDLCDRYKTEVDGWVLLQDDAIRVVEQSSVSEASSCFPAEVIGGEFVGSQRRTRLAVEGRHGVFEITVPFEAVPQGKPLCVQISVSDQATPAITGPRESLRM